MNIVKLVILFCDHCVLLCNMCKRFGILLFCCLLFLCFFLSFLILFLLLEPLSWELLAGSFSSELLRFLKHFDQDAQKGAGPLITTIITKSEFLLSKLLKFGSVCAQTWFVIGASCADAFRLLLELRILPIFKQRP